MVATTKLNTSRLKVQKHRAGLRRQGLRPLQLWVPDTRTAAFRQAARLQSLAVSRSRKADDDQAFIDSLSPLD